MAELQEYYTVDETENPQDHQPHPVPTPSAHNLPRSSTGAGANFKPARRILAPAIREGIKSRRTWCFIARCERRKTRCLSEGSGSNAADSEISSRRTSSVRQARERRREGEVERNVRFWPRWSGREGELYSERNLYIRYAGFGAGYWGGAEGDSMTTQRIGPTTGIVSRSLEGSRQLQSLEMREGDGSHPFRAVLPRFKTLQQRYPPPLRQPLQGCETTSESSSFPPLRVLEKYIDIFSG
ncbi:hypothetical protein FB45DRAFT_862361 [Roridomyces roridus]|uniref:Uncharacterized protein n=1 Tax=Roridomyces roridus TaxID=1738132 RepID=A0AAD7C917_9AGAR|nr:hypothetical protein FB45DRAFT_862361 [Roridomyces roridus]